MAVLKLTKISLSVRWLVSPALSMIDLNSARHMKGFSPGFSFNLEFRL